MGEGVTAELPRATWLNMARAMELARAFLPGAGPTPLDPLWLELAARLRVNVSRAPVGRGPPYTVELRLSFRDVWLLAMMANIILKHPGADAMVRVSATNIAVMVHRVTQAPGGLQALQNAAGTDDGGGLFCPVHGEVALCAECRRGPCPIALMPGEACPCKAEGCQCHGPCDP